MGSASRLPSSDSPALYHRLHFRTEAARKRAFQKCHVLYVLRLVVEGDESANKRHGGQLAPLRDAYAEQAAALKAVLQAAQAEAAAWRLDEVNLWEPSSLGKRIVEQSGPDGTWVERQEDGVACARWAGEGSDGVDEPPISLNNEYYAWC
ncbi:hypothetical protein MAN_08948, partial [Metarhizium hybridum]